MNSETRNLSEVLPGWEGSWRSSCVELEVEMEFKWAHQVLGNGPQLWWGPHKLVPDLWLDFCVWSKGVK